MHVAGCFAQLESNVAAADIVLSDGEYHALQVVSVEFCPGPHTGIGISSSPGAVLGLVRRPTE